MSGEERSERDSGGAGRTPKIEAGVTCPYDGDSREGFYLSVPFRQSFVSWLKGRARHGDRRWNPEAERWWVVAEYQDDVEEKLVEEFGGFKLSREDGPDLYRDGGGTFEQTSLI